MRSSTLKRLQSALAGLLMFVYFFVNLIVCFFWPVSMAATYMPEGNEEVSTALFPFCILHEYTKSPERLKMLRLASEPAWLLSKLAVIMLDVSSYDKVFMLVLLSVLCVFFWYIPFALLAFTDVPVRLMRLPEAS